ncbi:MAG: hypothetical protein ACF8XB_19635 [Planctomycetota bacterium JB042]
MSGPVLLLACALAAAPPAVELRLDVPPEPVVPGRAFPLTVVRAWSSELRPEPWRNDALAPLVVREVATVAREEPADVSGGPARRVEERRFEAWAFSRAPVELAPSFVATAPDGEARSAAPRTWTVDVRPAVDAADPGAAEPPGELLPVPGGGPGALEVALALAVLVAAAGLLLRSRRRRSVEPRPSIERVRRTLAELRERPSGGVAAAEVAEVARALFAVRCGVPVDERTTEELLAAAASAPGIDDASLASVLRAADREKFAGRETSTDEAARLLDDAERLVAAASAAPDAADGGGA